MNAIPRVRIGHADFDLAAEVAQLRAGDPAVGAVVSFVGTVRDRNAGRVQSSVAGRVRNTQERLHRLRAHPVRRPPDPLRFRGRFGGRASGTLLELEGVRVGDRLERLRAARGREISMIFQNPASHLDPLMTIGDHVAEPLRFHFGLSAAEARAEAQ